MMCFHNERFVFYFYLLLLLLFSGYKFKPSTKGSNVDEVFKYQMPISNEAEPDERRMSDLSDWAPSIASSLDIQVYFSTGFSYPFHLAFGKFCRDMIF